MESVKGPFREGDKAWTMACRVDPPLKMTWLHSRSPRIKKFLHEKCVKRKATTSTTQTKERKKISPQRVPGLSDVKPVPHVIFRVTNMPHAACTTMPFVAWVIANQRTNLVVGFPRVYEKGEEKQHSSKFFAA